MLNRIKSLFAAPERKSVGLDSLADLLGAGSATAAGIAVGPEAAMRCSPAFACVRAIAETVQQVPCHVFRRLPDGGRERVTDHPAAKVLRNPSDFMTAAEFKLLVGMHIAAHGNFFAWIGRDGAGNPIEMIPLDPRRVSVKADELTMAPVYRVTAGNGAQQNYSRADLLHVRGPGLDIYRGDSPVALAREAIGLHLTIENHCASTFGSGAKPSGVMKIKGKKSEEALRRFRAMFEQFYHGNSGRKTMILDDDMDFAQVQLSSVDTQTLETRRFQVAEISRFWRVPLSMLNDLERVQHSNAEALGQQFLTFCMLPIFRSITDSLALSLLRADERDEFYFEFLVDDLARADLAARMTSYATAVSHGILSPDECRQLDSRPPVPDGSGAVFTRPVNVAPVATTAPEAAP